MVLKSFFGNIWEKIIKELLLNAQDYDHPKYNESELEVAQAVLNVI